MTADSRLAGKVALVTGARRGIGAACARKLAEHGATVVLSDIEDEACAQTARDIGGSASSIHLNVRDLKSWESGMAGIVERFGGLDILVNNAGGGAGGKIHLETPEQHQQIVELNLTGVWSGIRSAIPHMEKRGGGSIINISSIDGLVGVSGLSTYVATKFAVTGITRSLAMELGPRGIRVNSVHPGITDTELVRAAPPAHMERMNKAIARQPIARIGKPEEVAFAVLFFASDESSYCTGTQLVVDGGHIAGPYRDPVD